MEKDDKIIHLELTDAREEYLAEQIELGMDKIYEVRQSIDFDKQVRRNNDYYEQIMDPNKWGPWEGSAKYFMGLVTTHVDIISIKGLRQTVGIHPIIQLKPDDDVDIDNNIIRDREDRLDHLLRNELKIDKLLKGGVYREASVQGVSFVKLCHSHQVEHITYNRKYNTEQIEQYKIDSWETLGHSEETAAANIAKLLMGESVTVRVSEERDIHYGPKAYRVPIKDLYLRLDIKEMSRQRLIAEKLRYTWKDIQERLDVGYFRQKAINKIKSQFEDDYFAKDYELYECILYAKVDSKFRRFVVTYDPDSKAVLRAIYYPYEHGRIYYVPYYIKERDDSVCGYSIVDMLAESNDYINNLLNGMLDRTSLDNNPVLQVPTKSKLAAYKWGPNAMLPADEEIRVLSTQNRSVDAGRLVGIMKQIAETLDGVSADILSGQTASSDPTGPAAKQAMQTQESNLRIEDYIISLQFGNEELAEQAESLKRQYAEQPVVDESQDVPVMFVAHGTTLGINKAQQIAIIKDYIAMVGMLAPDVVQDKEWRRQILNLYVNALGGVVEQYKQDLLPEEIGAMPMQQGQVDINGAINDLSPEEQQALMDSMGSMV